VTDEYVLPVLALGNILEQAGRWREAADLYQQLLAFEPDETQVKARLDGVCQQQPASCPSDH
jgi:hypothetical protein